MRGHWLLCVFLLYFKAAPEFSPREDKKSQKSSDTICPAAVNKIIRD